MNRWLLATWILFITAAGPGCAQMFSSRTYSCYKSGTTEICYESTKNQENFHAKVGLNPDGTLKDLDVSTTATTAESAIAAALQLNTVLIQELMPLIKQAAAMGAGS